MSVHSRICPACGTEDYRDYTEGQISGQHDATGIDEMTSHSGEKMAVLARFNNSAEAGYFTDELEQTEQIEARLTVQDHFEALTGRWRHDFVLLVPESQLELAALRLKSYSQDPSEADAEYDELHHLSGEMTPVGVNWVPILLTTLAAGSVAYWGVKKIEEKPRPPVLRNDHGEQVGDIWEVLSGSEGPWIQRFDGDGGIRLLKARADGTAILQEDRDGDGHFEREFRLHR